ncbi:MAG: peptidase M48 [Saprospiraceae bacterium]|nr:MAG: peptidase M48 [Saprospiraceae bacterium]
MRVYQFLVLVALSFTLSFAGCGTTGGGGGFNLFSPEQDIELGKEVEQQIASDPKTYPILPEASNAEVYRYIRGITTKILNSGKVSYRDEFAWQVKIIDDPETLNAFCTPGGYIYVYTGLIKFLDSEDELAGVMGHEIAHAALRHSTRQMTQIYGISALTSIVTGKSDPGLIEQIALSLVSLKFSRSHETEADSHSVLYLCSTDYNADGAAGFFRKIESKGGGTPEFLSTHPNPGNRVQNIEKEANGMSCGVGKSYESEYARIKQLLR